VIALGLACERKPGAATHPPAEAYDTPSDFAGTWQGEIAGAMGELAIAPLGPGRYRATFVADDQPLRYVMALEQPVVANVAGQAMAGNLALVTWQDGRGGRGKGWVLVNRENSALTGSYGRDDATDGLGEWTFIRVD
jgi:hypothetical protein